jgi:hypothetical protein
MTQTFYEASVEDFGQHSPELMKGLRRFVKVENERGRIPQIDKANWQQQAEEFKPSIWEKPMV